MKINPRQNNNYGWIDLKFDVGDHILKFINPVKCGSDPVSGGGDIYGTLWLIRLFLCSPRVQLTAKPANQFSCTISRKRGLAQRSTLHASVFEIVAFVGQIHKNL